MNHDLGALVALRMQHRPPSAPALTLATPEPWMDEALCAQVDMDLFFPEQGGSPRAAKKICAVCPVTTECLTYALEHNERQGIWGGTTEKDRRRLRRGAA